MVADYRPPVNKPQSPVGDGAAAAAGMPANIGRYRLLEKLGQGGMGIVYRAHDSELKREVAIKTVIDNCDGTIIKRFAKEAAAMARLHHHGIVEIYDIGNQLGKPFLAMELVRGRSLKEAIAAGRLPARQIAEIMKRVAEAIQHAHDHGILHRDIKPSNIMLDDSGQPRVMDFGLALDVSGDSRISRTGIPLGTPIYMSPEQARGRKREMDERSDVYSLGAVLYEMLTGVPPFHGEKAHVLVQVMRDEPPRPCRLSPAVPRALENICRQAMAKQKGLRYQSARELADDLGRFLDNRPVLAKTPGIVRFTRVLVRRNWPLAAAISLALVLSLLLFTSPSKSAKSIVRTHPDMEKTATEHRRYVEQVMAQLAHTAPESGVVDRCVTELVRRKSVSTVAALLTCLQTDTNVWQRRVVIEALGQLGDKDTRVAGRDSVSWLLQLLAQADLQNPDGYQEAQELIWALGRLADARANQLVAQVRNKAGSNSVLWNNTKIPYAWIPETSDGSGDNVLAEASEYYNRGLARDNKGDKKGALTDYNRAIALDPALAAPYNNRGNLYAEQGLLDLALADYDACLARNPSYANAYLNRGMVYAARKDFAGAIADYDRAIELEPGMAEAYGNRASPRKCLGDIAGALADCNKAIELNPFLDGVYCNRGDIYFTQGHVDLALADYNKALSLNARLHYTYLNRGNLYRMCNQMSKAIADYSKAIELDRDFALAYANRGRARCENGDLDGALADCNKAIELDPTQAQAHSTRGHIKNKQGDVAGSLVDCNKAIALDAGLAEAYFHRSNVWSALGKNDEAMADCQKAIDLDPKFPEAYCNRGTFWQAKGDLTRAIIDYNTAIALRPTFAEAYLDRGTARQFSGDAASAMQDYSLAIEIDPQFWQAHYNLGLLLMQENANAKALKCFNNVIALKPDFAAAYKARAGVLTINKDLRAAVADYRRYLQMEPNEPQKEWIVSFIRKHAQD